MAKQWVQLVLLATVQLLLAAASVVASLRPDGTFNNPSYALVPNFAICVAQTVLGSMLGVLLKAWPPVRLAVALAVPVAWYEVGKFFPYWQLDQLFWISAPAIGAGWILRLAGFRLTHGVDPNENRGRQFSILQVIELTAWCGLLAGGWRMLPARSHAPHVSAVTFVMLGCVTVFGCLGTSSLLRRSLLVLITFLVICGGIRVLNSDVFDVGFRTWMSISELIFVVIAVVPLRMLGYRLTTPPRVAA